MSHLHCLVIPSHCPVGDATGALGLAFGIACALLDARSSGRGRVVDGAIVDVLAMLGTITLMARAWGQVDGPEPCLFHDSPFYEVYTCSDGGLITLHLRSHLIDQGLLRIEMLRGLKLLFCKRLKTLQVQLVILQVRLVFGLFCSRLLQSRDKRALINFQERIALLHHLSLLEGNFGDLSVDTALDRYRLERRDDSKTVDVHRKVSLLHLE